MSQILDLGQLLNVDPMMTDALMKLNETVYCKQKQRQNMVCILIKGLLLGFLQVSAKLPCHNCCFDLGHRLWSADWNDSVKIVGNQRAGTCSTYWHCSPHAAQWERTPRRERLWGKYSPSRCLKNNTIANRRRTVGVCAWRLHNAFTAQVMSS